MDETKDPMPAVDFVAAGGVDLPRLERSLRLSGERVGEGRYRVSGGVEAHWVDLYTAQYPRCDCADHLWREAICKHILAALLRDGNEYVIGALFGLATPLCDEPKAASRCECGTRAETKRRRSSARSLTGSAMRTRVTRRTPSARST